MRVIGAEQLSCHHHYQWPWYKQDLYSAEIWPTHHKTQTQHKHTHTRTKQQQKHKKSIHSCSLVSSANYTIGIMNAIFECWTMGPKLVLPFFSAHHVAKFIRIPSLATDTNTTETHIHLSHSRPLSLAHTRCNGQSKYEILPSGYSTALSANVQSLFIYLFSTMLFTRAVTIYS